MALALGTNAVFQIMPVHTPAVLPGQAIFLPKVAIFDQGYYRSDFESLAVSRSDYQATGIDRLSEMIENISLRMAAMEANMVTKQDLVQMEMAAKQDLAQIKANMATKQELEQLGNLRIVSDSLRVYRSSSSDKHR